MNKHASKMDDALKLQLYNLQLSKVTSTDKVIGRQWRIQGGGYGGCSPPPLPSYLQFMQLYQ